MKNSSKAIVIGAGIAGIASAIRLAVKGYAVDVFESNAYPGGKLTAFEQNGFRFDAGPSLFTMPQLVDELFELAGKTPSDHFKYTKQDESCRYFWEDGTRLTAFSDHQKLCSEIDVKLGNGGKETLDFLEHSANLYDYTGKIFTEKSLHKAGTWFSKDVAKALLHLPQFDLGKTMHVANQKRLPNKKLVQLFDRYATYNGSDPYQAPGILNVIPHLEHNVGTFFPERGMHQITQSLVALAEELGVAFHYNTPVLAIDHESGTAHGISTKNGKHLANLVVCNMDVVPAYRKLMPGIPAPEKTLQQERSSSALIFYLGIDAAFDALGLHNIFFSDDYKAEFEAIFQTKTVSEDPTIYIHISSKVEQSDAPEGKENWFVMVNVPANTGQDWDVLIPKVRATVLNKLCRILGKAIEPLIVAEDQLNPMLIEQRTSSYQGALYGAASNDKFAAFLRHPNAASKCKNLYFCGGSVHPGGGIPLCLLSAKLVGESIPLPL